MPPIRRAYVPLLLASLTSCRPAAQTAPQGESPRPLAAFATQRIAVTPTAHVRVDSLGWVQQLGPRAVARLLDTSLVAVFDARGIAERWVLPAALQRAYERNRTYAADPYQLMVEQIRAPTFKVGQRYGEPLSSQLRTMIAIEEDTRFVLLPVDLRFERAAPGARAVVRLVLVDPRFAESRYVAEVSGVPAGTARAALSSVAARVADLFVAP